MNRIVRAVARRLGLGATSIHTRPAGEVFDAWARDGRDLGMEQAHGPVVRRVLEELELGRGSRYLDLGCGNGYTVRWVASERGATAVGLDASEDMVARARTLSQGMADVSFARGSFPDHALEPASFDVIFSMETMYYMTDLDVALKEVLSLLKPGGLFVSAIDFYRENRESHGWTGYVGAEMHLLSARDWHRAFERAGFRSVSQERLIVPEAEAREPWHATVGCLVTRGWRH